MMQKTEVSAAEVPQILKDLGLKYRSLSQVNWPQAFPYKPDVEFAAAVHDGALLLHYKVREKRSAAVESEDNGRIWEDSCCEFFCAFDDSGYYNIEANCIGRVNFAFGPERNQRIPAPGEALASISRWSSIGCEPFSERHVGEWELALAVPFKVFFAGSVDASSFKRLRFNVYKCGDRLSTPHFLSFAPIHTPKPDFHRPEFFVQEEF